MRGASSQSRGRRVLGSLAMLGAVGHGTKFEFLYFGCASLNYCNGHGRCRAGSPGSPTESCVCQNGWGGPDDVAIDKMLDCTQRTCPLGIATSEMPSGTDTAHPLRECSNNGLCDRLTGKCECYAGWVGRKCERRGCPNGCSGHGQCMSMAEYASRPDALPLSRPNATLNNSKIYYMMKASTSTWDERIGNVCLCDSSWPVGLGPGQRQDAEWFGPDCSQRHCPSNDDPATPQRNESDCSNKTAAGGRGVGDEGNECHVDCSNRGSCNYGTGICSCYAGHYGNDCSLFNLHSDPFGGRG